MVSYAPILPIVRLHLKKKKKKKKFFWASCIGGARLETKILQRESAQFCQMDLANAELFGILNFGKHVWSMLLGHALCTCSKLCTGGR